MSDPAPVTDTSQIVGRSFAVLTDRCVTPLDPDDRASGEVACSWVFHVRADEDDRIALVVYGPEVLETVGLERRGDGWTMQRGVQLTTSYVWDSLTGVVPELRSGRLELKLSDTDNDGGADRLRAAGPGVYEKRGDDYSHSYDVSIDFEAVLDTNAPVLGPVREEGTVLLYGFPFVRSSEPLAPGAEADLEVAGEPIEVMAELDAETGTVTGFTAARLPPQNSSWRWTVRGSDLAGNRVEDSLDGQSGSLPAALPAGDFEGEAPFLEVFEYPYCSVPEWLGPAESFDLLAAIAEERSFLVAPGFEVLFRLARPPGTTTLRLSLQLLFELEPSGVMLKSFVEEGSEIRRTEVLPELTQAGEPAPGSVMLQGGLFAGAPQELTIPLEGVEGDVVLIVDAPCSEGASSSRSGAWIDSIQFE